MKCVVTGRGSGGWSHTRGAGLLTIQGDTDLAMEDTSDTSGDQLLRPQINYPTAA